MKLKHSIFKINKKYALFFIWIFIFFLRKNTEFLKWYSSATMHILTNVKERGNCGNSEKDKERSKENCQLWIHLRVWKEAYEWHKFVGTYSSKERLTMSRNSKTLSYWRIHWTSQLPHSYSFSYTSWSYKNKGKHETQDKNNRGNSTANSRWTIGQHLWGCDIKNRCSICKIHATKFIKLLIVTSKGKPLKALIHR